MSVSNLAFVYRTAQANLRQMLPDFRFHLKKKKQNRVTICYLNVLYFIVLKIITIINKLLEAPRFPYLPSNIEPKLEAKIRIYATADVEKSFVLII